MTLKDLDFLNLEKFLYVENKLKNKLIDIVN